MTQVSKKLRQSTYKVLNWKKSNSYIIDKPLETHDDRHIMEEYSKIFSSAMNNIREFAINEKRKIHEKGVTTQFMTKEYKFIDVVDSAGSRESGSLHKRLIKTRNIEQMQKAYQTAQIYK